jgi:alkylation response protein AidB-like acyl-CoA dehydrogenase
MNYPRLPAAVLRPRVSAAPNRNEEKLLAKPPGRVTDHLEAIARLAPLIAEHRAAFDSARHLPDAVFDALAEAGLFRLWLPEALGGPQLVIRAIS